MILMTIPDISNKYGVPSCNATLLKDKADPNSSIYYYQNCRRASIINLTKSEHHVEKFSMIDFEIFKKC